MTVLVLGGFFLCTGSHRHFRSLRVGRGACSSRLIHYLARQNVRFRDRVLGGEGLRLAGSQAGNRPCILGQFIPHGDVRQGQVTVIGSRDLVGDLLAQNIGSAVGGGAGGFLVDGQVTVLVLGVHLIGVLERFAVAERRRNVVGKATRQNVRFRDGIGRSGGHCIAGSHVLEYGLADGHTLLLGDGDSLGLIVDVCHRDGEGHRVAQAILPVIVGLGDNLVGVNSSFHASIGHF